MTEQSGHDESSKVYNYAALPETRLVDSLIQTTQSWESYVRFVFTGLFCGRGARGNACLSSLFCGRTRRNFGLRMPHCCKFPLTDSREKKWQFEVTPIFFLSNEMSWRVTQLQK